MSTGSVTPYVPQSARQTLTRIFEGTAPWVAMGDFVDGWNRSDLPARERMILEPLPQTDSAEIRCWAALIAAAIDWLAWNAEPDRITPPAWVDGKEFVLPRPWFLYPGWRLRMHQLVDTPAPFKRRNIFGGDRILTRV